MNKEETEYLTDRRTRGKQAPMHRVVPRVYHRGVPQVRTVYSRLTLRGYFGFRFREGFQSLENSLKSAMVGRTFPLQSMVTEETFPRHPVWSERRLADKTEWNEKADRPCAHNGYTYSLR